MGSYFKVFVRTLILLLPVTFMFCSRKDEKNTDIPVIERLYDTSYVINNNTLQNIAYDFLSVAVDTLQFKIYVSDMDNSSIYSYDIKSNILYKIGREGVGPGEFYQPVSISLLDTILCVVDNHRKLKLLNKGGSFIKEINPMSKIADGHSHNISYTPLIWSQNDSVIWFGIGEIGEDQFIYYVFFEINIISENIKRSSLKVKSPVWKVASRHNYSFYKRHRLTNDYIAPVKEGFYIKDGEDLKLYYVDYETLDYETISFDAKNLGINTKRVKVPDELIKNIEKNIQKYARYGGIQLLYFSRYPVIYKIFPIRNNIYILLYEEYLNNKDKGIFNYLVYNHYEKRLEKYRVALNMVGTEGVSPIEFGNSILDVSEKEDKLFFRILSLNSAGKRSE